MSPERILNGGGGVIEGRTMSGLDQMVQMQRTLKDNEARLGGEFSVVRVGEAGYILQPNRRKPRAFADFIAFDVDDTMLASSRVKDIRKATYKTYLRGLDVIIPDDAANQLMDDTYDFARNPVGKGNYLTHNHVVALDWVTRELQGATEEQIGDRVQNIKDTLTRIGSGEIQDDDPFSIVGRHLVSRSPEPPSHDIQSMFQHSLLAIPQFDEVVDAVTEIGKVEEVNVGLFTLGDPHEQLLKMCKLLAENPQMAVDQIWITNVPKDEFIKTMIETEAHKELPLEYTDGEDSGDGYIFGDHPHVMVVLDDSIGSLESLLAANEILAETNAEIAVVRAARSGTKDGHKKWDKSKVIDFNDGEKTGGEIAKILLEVRSANLERRFGRPSVPGQIVSIDSILTGVSSDKAA